VCPSTGLVHRLEHLCGVLGGEAIVEEWEVDLLLLREVNADQRIQPVQDAME
jgi:hypothetical protein